MLCIYYLVLFNSVKVKALLDLASKINAITSTFVDKLGFSI